MCGHQPQLLRRSSAPTTAEFQAGYLATGYEVRTAFFAGSASPWELGAASAVRRAVRGPRHEDKNKAAACSPGH